MIKQVIIALFLFVFINIICDAPLGPWLSKLALDDIRHNGDKSPFILTKFESLGYYQMLAFHQPSDQFTCERNTLFNLFFVMDALSRNKSLIIKKKLRPIFNGFMFYSFNDLICDYLKIKHPYDYTYGDQINSVILSIQNKDITNVNKSLKLLLPPNADHIAYQIMPAMWFKNKKALKMVEDNQIKTNQEIVQILNGIVNGKELCRWISIFKAAKDRKIFGIPFSLPYDSDSQHSIAIICRKFSHNKFEFFVLDSYNSKEASWLNMLNFLKHLINLSSDRLQAIIDHLK